MYTYHLLKYFPLVTWTYFFHLSEFPFTTSTIVVTNHSIRILNIKREAVYIIIEFFKKFINSQNKYFVIDFEEPVLISTTF